jgi:hypothetical protein
VERETQKPRTILLLKEHHRAGDAGEAGGIRPPGKASGRGTGVREWRKNGPDQKSEGTKESRRNAKRESEGSDSIVTIAIGGESPQEPQQCAFARAVEDALFGSAESMRLVVNLKDETMPANESESTRSGFSQADAWRAEPEWTGEASEELAETAAGGWEPED